MSLTPIGADRHLYTIIDQSKIALIHNGLHPFIDEIKIDFDSSPQSSPRQLDNSLNTGMGRGCG
jgi:hypothetical protein